MARAETVTLLPLDRYAEIMQIPLTHFNQLQGPKAPLVGGCDDIWDQDDRELLAWTMAEAEEGLETTIMCISMIFGCNDKPYSRCYGCTYDMDTSKEICNPNCPRYSPSIVYKPNYIQR